MYVHTKTVAWLTRRNAAFGGLTLRKGLYTGGFALAHAVMCSSVSIARFLDRFLYPAFEQTPLTPPVFVIATPRSGTTFLHHLLALDDEQFVSFKLYQTIAPSVILDRAIGVLREANEQAGLGLGRLLDAIDRRMFTSWNGIHRVGLRADEEDENLFVYSLVSPALYMLFPAVRAIPELIDLSGFPQKTLRRLAHDYRETVRRLLFVTGGQRTPLIKNVLLPSRLSVAKLAFPKARYIHIVRDPREAIPSAVSLFYAMWQSHSPEIAADSPETRALAEMFLKHYRLLCDEKQKAPESWITVRFESLVADPVGTISQIYEQLGMPISAGFRARLERAAADGRRFKSRHSYDLARFGLSEEELRDALEPHWDSVTGADLESTALALD
jgi:omega-hydroxy-beta-dihydromenaquinone-9 sulfotransferase